MCPVSLKHGEPRVTAPRHSCFRQEFWSNAQLYDYYGAELKVNLLGGGTKGGVAVIVEIQVALI